MVWYGGRFCCCRWRISIAALNQVLGKGESQGRFVHMLKIMKGAHLVKSSFVQTLIVTTQVYRLQAFRLLATAKHEI